MSLKVHILKARKVLVGSVGLATASFVGVGCSSTSVANLPAPPSCEVAPSDPYCIGMHADAGSDAPADVRDAAIDAVTSADTNQGSDAAADRDGSPTEVGDDAGGDAAGAGDATPG